MSEQERADMRSRFNETAAAADWGKKALETVSPEELVYDAAGGLGGGLLGYMLSRLVHRNPSVGRSMAYTLAGGILGAAGTHLMLGASSAGYGKGLSRLDEMRLEAASEYEKKLDESTRRSDANPVVRGLQLANDYRFINNAAAGAGAMVGMSGKGIDFSGSRKLEKGWKEFSTNVYRGRNPQKALTANQITPSLRSAMEGNRHTRYLLNHRDELTFDSNGNLVRSSRARMKDAAMNAGAAYLLMLGLEGALETWGAMDGREFNLDSVIQNFTGK